MFGTHSTRYHHQYRHQSPEVQWYNRSPHNAMYRPFGAFSASPSPSPSPPGSPYSASASASASSSGSSSGSRFLPGAAGSSFCPTAYSRSAERQRRLGPPTCWSASSGSSPPPYIPTPEEVQREADEAAWEAEEQSYYYYMEPGPRYPSNLMRGGREAWAGRLHEERMQREWEAEQRRLEREQQGHGFGSRGRALLGAIRRCFSWPFSAAFGSRRAETGAGVDYHASAEADTNSDAGPGSDASTSGWGYSCSYDYGWADDDEEEPKPRATPIEPLAKVYLRRLGKKLQLVALWLVLLLFVLAFMWALETVLTEVVETVVEAVLGGINGTEEDSEIVYVLVENYRSWCVASCRAGTE
ncbi:hypothetical protein SLS62_010052 [Diatrype stigma]|uniref:Transmembrane protein n=1 Tax=Diatrype stigma TaxID=117547 RepID=A0AAN9UAW6_9PEZI